MPPREGGRATVWRTGHGAGALAVLCMPATAVAGAVLQDSGHSLTADADSAECSNPCRSTSSARHSGPSRAQMSASVPPTILDPDCRVHIRADVLREHDGPMLKWGLQEMDKTGRSWIQSVATIRSHPHYAALARSAPPSATCSHAETHHRLLRPERGRPPAAH